MPDNLYKFAQMDPLAARVARVEDAIPYQVRGSSYAKNRRAAFSATSVDSLNNGVIDLNSPDGLDIIGSIAPIAVNAPFAIAKNTTTGIATIYWDGTNGSSIPVVHRADKTSAAAPAGNIAISGLSASTWYAFLAFWSNSNPCSIGFVAGDSGSPAYLFAGGTGASFVASATADAQAQALQSQSLLGREPLTTGFATFQMPAAGTSSGGAGGGGSAGSCVMVGTNIEPLGNIHPNDWEEVRHRQNEWIRVVTASGRNLNCTPNHPLYDSEWGKIPAETVKVGRWIISETGEDKIVDLFPFKRMCTKIEVKMKYGHLYWANGLLSHNVKSFAE